MDGGAPAMTRWAALAAAGCLTALAGIFWYIRCLEDRARRVHLAWPLSLFAAGLLTVAVALAGAVEWGD
jgi:hypothetical protein